MDAGDLAPAVVALCPDVEPGSIEEFLARMDEDYRRRYTPSEIATHVRMAQELDGDRPVRVGVVPREGRRFDVTVVGYDAFGAFSILCGLLAAFGLDIRSGHVHTFAPRARSAAPPRRGGAGRSAPSPRRFVDVFHVVPGPDVVFDADEWRELETELQGLHRLLRDDRLPEARDRLNRRLIEKLEAVRGRFTGVLYPVDVRFDAVTSEQWTVMDVHSQDTPAFLYSLSNGLSMRGIYIHKVEIESVGREVKDRFFISDRSGRKIESREDQASLRMAVGLIKQFTHFLPRAPDPATAIHYFDQFLDKVLEARSQGRRIPLFDEEGKEGESLSTLARLLGSSEFLWEDFLRMQFENLLPLLEDLQKRDLRRGKRVLSAELAQHLAAAETIEEKKRALNDFKDREMFSIDMKQLLDPSVSLESFSTALTDLAEVVVQAALDVCDSELRRRHGAPRLADGRPCPFTVCGLGKFGGGELGYASDIELLFVYGGDGETEGPQRVESAAYFEELARRVVDLIEARQEGIFHIDLRLRPHGSKGSLATSFDALKAYYRPAGDAAPFERQALIKLRRVAGDEALGQAVEAFRDAFVYSGEPWDVAGARHLRGRQIRELVEPGRVNVKYGPGGLVDIEYGVQYLQILHGRRHPELRTPSTLEALDRLHAVGVLSEQEHDEFPKAYRFLRQLMEGLRMVHGNAKDLILPPEDSEEFKLLARRLRYHAPEGWAESARLLAADVHRHMACARHFYTGRFGAPEEPDKRRGGR